MPLSLQTDSARPGNSGHGRHGEIPFPEGYLLRHRGDQAEAGTDQRQQHTAVQRQHGHAPAVPAGRCGRILRRHGKLPSGAICMAL